MSLSPPQSLPELPFEDQIHRDPMSVDVPDDTQTIIVDSDSGAVIVHNTDGSATVDLDPQTKKEKPTDFNANLAVHIDRSELTRIGSELIQGIEADLQSRSEWEMIYNKAIDLLGLKLEEASAEISNYGTMSKVYHPLLLEAVVRSQANARAELLPVNGPVKVRDDEPQGDQERVILAEAMEKDFNHYLTVVDKSYYTDTDKMFFSTFLSGNGFKKIYRCPLKRRPVSVSVSPQDLIVSNDAIDLISAIRVTHRIYMTQSTMKRMQLSGQYRKVELGEPNDVPNLNESNIKSIEGLDRSYAKLPQDHRFTVYETYVELDLQGFEHEEDGELTGLPLPYRVTVEKDTMEVVEIRRNWKEGDEDFATRRRFVKYPVIPGLGFYDYGFMHLLGNTTRALTAIERQLLDAGQFGNFPGLLISKQGQRQTTNQIRVPPGGAHEIDTGGQPLQDVVMPLPYKGASATLADIAEKIAEDGRRLASTTEISAGEGRADVPVGTTIALIEQATKVIGVVHKRLHAAQQEEFEIFKELFQEDPEALWKFAKNPARKWQMAEEFSDLDLVPASDPNIPSHVHRIMQATALVQLAQAAPQIYNIKEVHERALHTLGIGDADSLFAPPAPPGSAPNPELQAKQMEMQSQDKENQIKLMEQQREAQTSVLETESREKDQAMQLQDHQSDRENKLELARLKLQEENIKAETARRTAMASSNDAGSGMKRII